MPHTLHRGDALSVLSELPDASVDALITDLPYNSGGRTSSERTGRTAKSKYTAVDAEHQLANFPGENRDQRSYGYWLSLLLTEAYRATVESGTALVFTDWRQLPTTTDALQAAGWTWRGIASWHKPVSRPQKGRLKQSCEYIVWGTKGPVDPARNPVYLPGLYQASQPRKGRVHITQKPVEVMQELVKICPEAGTVLDPFTGSGSTGVAALREGRQFVGVELSDHYADIAEQRMAAELTQDDFGLAGPEE
ncbi:site-specific DNA-methyltransferase [Streptomyces sp. NBC_01795]|uniref:DNA-methyltransferase n=1 Tax=Streptomyces sp. NBC_01795 TaxID=2975943 RepID=UPI002DD83FA7|nr:site-specific DNA-methyltransferase [Streptomyces sp. NBC_01795]WSA96702.1 site-specific DNA-methyltransferase [Streptomyces sp. NBC_01795]